MGIRRYKAKPIVFFTLLGFIAFSLLSTESFAQFAGCGPNEVRDVTGECVSVFEAVVAWDKSSYRICDIGIITFNGQEENTDPNLIQIFFIQVTSDSDPTGVEVAMIESGNNTGVFTGEVQLCGNLNVSEGDKVYVSYGNIGDAASIEGLTSSIISVSTDRSSYGDGDTIIISGQVGEILSGFSVSLHVISSIGNLVTLQQLDVSSYGTFSTTLSAGGPQWQSSGTYTVKVLYGTEARTAETTFTFTASEPVITPPSPPRTDVIIPIGSSVPGCETTNSCWIPSTISVDVGDTVTWYNADTAAHTVTSGTATGGPDGNFDSSTLRAGYSFSHTFRTSGEYPYFDMLHPWMVGTVIVKGTSSGIVDTVPPLLLTPSDITIDATDSSGARVDYSVKAIDDNDGILRPNCFPSSGSLFPIGKTTVTCSATDNSGNSDRKSFLITVNPPDVLIPSWIKDVAGFWCGDEIDNASFIEAIQYLINNDVIIVPATASSGTGVQEIPNWVKSNACWWSQGLISNSDFASGLQYLIGQGIIKI